MPVRYQSRDGKKEFSYNSQEKGWALEICVGSWQHIDVI